MLLNTSLSGLNGVLPQGFLLTYRNYAGLLDNAMERASMESAPSTKTTKEASLSRKKPYDLSNVPGAEKLTEKQADYLSLQLGGWTISEIARKHSVHRSTVQEAIEAAKRKLAHQRENRSNRHRSGNDEEDRLIREFDN